MRVKSKDEWLEIVAPVLARIDEVARNPSNARVLRGTRQGAWRESASQTVARFFEDRGIVLPAPVEQEIAQRKRQWRRHLPVVALACG